MDSHFLDYFKNYYLNSLTQYIQKNTFQSRNFQGNYLMQKPVLQFLTNNKRIINTIFKKFSKNNKMKFTDILKMLNDKKVEFKTLNYLQH